MKTIGIDLGSRKSHVCIRDEQAQIIEEHVVQTQDLSWWLECKAPAGSTVVLETCSETWTIARCAKALKHRVRIVPAAVVGQLGVGHRGVKNDVRDARVLSRASIALGDELPTVHLPSLSAQDVVRLMSQRSLLVKTRTSLINAIKSQLRSQLMRLPSGSSSSVVKRTRAQLAENPQLLAALEPVLVVLQSTQESIETLDKDIKARCQQSEEMQRAMTVPGVGMLTASCWVSSIDDLSRFSNASQLASYIGLTPGEHSTGGKTRHTSITRAGKTQLRTLLIQAAWSHVRTQPQSALTVAYRKLAQHKPAQVAIVAVARRLVKVLYAMMRKGCNYEPARLRSRSTTSVVAGQIHAALSN